MPSPRSFAPFALPLLLAGCIDHHDECTTCDTQALYEVEINDTAPQANWVGVLYPGDALSIRGHVTKTGPDLFDGFAFVTGAPMSIDVSLWADAHGVDLDLCVWDPVFDEFVVCFESAASPEGGDFVILESGKEFHLVVRSFHGDSAYWLDVVGAAAAYGVEAGLSAHAALRAPGAWDDYTGRASAPAAAPPGRPALILSYAADGSLLASEPARVQVLSRH